MMSYRRENEIPVDSNLNRPTMTNPRVMTKMNAPKNENQRTGCAENWISIFTTIKSAINNAKVFVEHFGADEDAFSEFLWSFVDGEPVVNYRERMEDITVTTEASTEMSKALKKMGFSFIGPTTCYAMMQAAGMVDDHLVSCFRHTSNRRGP